MLQLNTSVANPESDGEYESKDGLLSNQINTGPKCDEVDYKNDFPPHHPVSQVSAHSDGKLMETKDSVLRYQIRHGGLENMHICEVCDEEFVTKFTLSKHIKTKHNRKVVGKCNVCSKVFYTSAGLKRHMKSHAGEYRHYCITCQPKCGFQEKHMFEAHMCKYHDHPKQYVCKVCSKTFSSNFELNRHHRKSHGHNKKAAPVPDSPVACDVCQKVFSNQKDLTQHMQEHVHLRYQCDKCGEQYRWLSGYNRHLELCKK